jgi:hypothetical protein
VVESSYDHVMLHPRTWKQASYAQTLPQVLKCCRAPSVSPRSRGREGRDNMADYILVIVSTIASIVPQETSYPISLANHLNYNRSQINTRLLSL